MKRTSRFWIVDCGLWIRRSAIRLRQSTIHNPQSKITPTRRAFVLIAVLVIVGSALYVATALMFQAQADVISAGRAAQVAQSRALAWSGVQAVMSRLNEQRDRILAGQGPRLDDQYT